MNARPWCPFYRAANAETGAYWLAILGAALGPVGAWEQSERNGDVARDSARFWRERSGEGCEDGGCGCCEYCEDRAELRAQNTFLALGLLGAALGPVVGYMAGLYKADDPLDWSEIARRAEIRWDKVNKLYEDNDE